MAEEIRSLDEALAHDLGVLDRSGLRRTLRAVSSRQQAHLETAAGSVIDFSSNDYLGLASDSRIADALRTALDSTATGAAAARLISGNDRWHEALEQRIATYKGTESAVLFATGFAANIGAIPALARRGDVIYTDRFNHASLIDGCRLSRAETKVFGHCDLAELTVMLEADVGKFNRRWIVVDGVFSMDGDLFPLDELVPLARKYHAFTYVDDAHGTGVVGATGRGSAEYCDVSGQIDVTMGSLSKSFGVMGGFVAGSSVLCQWLVNRARAFIYTTGSSPVLAAATITAIDLAEQEPWRRQRVLVNAQRIRAGVTELGLNVSGGTQGHIVPVMIGEAAATVQIGDALRSRGILVGSVRPPTVPLGASRLRITASAAHTDSDIDALLGAMRDVFSGRS